MTEPKDHNDVLRTVMFFAVLAASPFTCVGLLFSWWTLPVVPPEMLLVVALCLLGITGVLHLKRPVLMLLSLLCLGFHCIVLALWAKGMTAGAVFDLQLMDNQVRVLDPDVERYLMGINWLVGALFCVVIGRMMCLSAHGGRPRPAGRPHLGRLIAVLVFELVTLLFLAAGGPNFRRFSMHNFDIPVSTSPDGKRQVRVEPMNCMIDIEGIVLWRRSDEFWWHPLGYIGESFSLERRGVFVWSDGSKAVGLSMGSSVEANDGKDIFTHRFSNND